MIWEQTVAENAWKVAEGLYRILLPLPWAVPFVNAYLAESRGQFMLVDCGFNWGTGLRSLGRALKAIGVPARGLTYLLLTHRHPDHASAAGPVHQRWGGQVLLHPADLGAFFPEAEAMAEWGRTHGLDEPLVARLLSRRREPVESLPERIDPLIMNEPLRLGDLSFELIHVPGHCPGQVMLHERERGWLLAADQVLNVLAPNVWANAGTTEDILGQYLESLERTAGVTADLILPSHGMPQRGGLRESAAAMAQFHQEYARRVYGSVTDQPRTSWEVARSFDPQTAADHREATSLLSEVLAALIHLERRGEVTRRGEALWVRSQREEAGT